MSVVVLAWKLTSQETVSKEEIAESTPTMLKIVAALLLAVAGYVQRTGGWIADRLRGRS
jgi:hypothetical protein